MIVPMKKITLIFDSDSTEESIHALRDFGAFHISSKSRQESPLKEFLEKKISVIKKAIDILSENKKTTPSILTEDEAFLLSQKIVEVYESIKTAKEELKQLYKELESAKKWGNSDLKTMEDLQDNGIEIRFFRCSKSEIKNFPEKAFSFKVYEDAGIIIAGIVNHKCLSSFVPALPEVFPPSRSLNYLSEAAEISNNRLMSLEAELEAVSQNKTALKIALSETIKKLEFEQFKSGVEQKDRLSIISGYCPESETERLKEISEDNSWAYVCEEPSEHDNVPTLLRHSGLSRLFKPVMDFVGIVPAYHEYDANMPFLLFFVIFFAILIGDAGYGILILLFTIISSRLTNLLTRDSIILLFVLAVAAIIWGGITGIWFASEMLAENRFLKTFIIPELYALSPESDITIPRLCMLIAFLQLSSAHIWRAARAYPSLLVVAEIGWIALLAGVFLIINFLILNSPASPLIKPLAVFGSICVFVFSGQNRDGFRHGMIRGLKNLPMTLLGCIGCFSDTVSYIRLFAVGLASKEMAIAFNSMAANVGFDSFLSATLSVLILLSGHGINIALAVMAVLVHGIRLNFLEYSTHLNMEWTGIPYSPFK